MKCKIEGKSDLDCFLENIPGAILCTRPKIRNYIKDKLLNGYVLMTGNIDCMEEFLSQMNPNWVEDFKYIQPMCTMTKYGMRYFYIVENNSKMRDVFNSYKKYYDVDELNTMIYCNFHDLISDGCVTEIIAINPDFRGDMQEKIHKLLDNFFMEDNEYDDMNKEKYNVIPEDVGKWLIENYHVKYYLKEFYIYKKTGNIKGYNKIDRNELGKLIEKIADLQKKGYNDQDIITDVDKFLEELYSR